MGWIQPPTFVDGQQVTAEAWNASIVDDLDWLYGASAVRLTNGADISVAAGYEVTTLALDTEALNTVADGHSPATSTGKVTVGQPGLYSVTVTFSFEPATAATRLFVMLMLNGVTPLAELDLDNATNVTLQPNLHALLPLRSGDELSVVVQQSNAGSEPIGAGADYSPVLTAVWVAGIYPVGGDDPDRIST